MTTELHHGDCLDIMRDMPDNSVDAVITDPPYGLSFMGKKWDYDVPAVKIWQEVLRVMKPGGFLLSFSGSRTYHRIAVNIEDAGFQLRDQIVWMYGSGFPKSHNISKGIDNLHGAEREVVGYTRQGTRSIFDGGKPRPATLWDGYGTALKPAHEPIVVAMKPTDGTFAQNALKHGTGGLNIDGCRVGNSERINKSSNVVGAGRERAINLYDAGGGKTPDGRDFDSILKRQKKYRKNSFETIVKGRWPANVMFSHHPECRVVGVSNTDPDGNETIHDYKCHPECPVAELDRQSGVSRSSGGSGHYANSMFTGQHNAGGLGDTGTASRYYKQFFYCAKASRRERNAGLEGMPEQQVGDGRKKSIDNPYQRGKTGRTNTHPTVKPLKLMRWLVRLVKPPGGNAVILDPFMGSGSTGIACVSEGAGFIGIEREPEYFEIARKRIAHHDPTEMTETFAEMPESVENKKPRQMSIFEALPN